jgi:maltose alpha-D-glucosyltransferase/alpha-amylase
MIALRQRHRTFGRGDTTILRPENRPIFAFVRTWEDDPPILVVSNLASTMQPASLDLSAWAGRVPIEMTGGTALPAITNEPYFLTLGPYGFYWLRLEKP